MLYLINLITGEIIEQAEKKGRLRKIQKQSDERANLKISKFLPSDLNSIKSEKKDERKGDSNIRHSERLKYQRDAGIKGSGKIRTLKDALRAGYEMYPTRLHTM